MKVIKIQKAFPFLPFSFGPKLLLPFLFLFFHEAHQPAQPPFFILGPAQSGLSPSSLAPTDGWDPLVGTIPKLGSSTDSARVQPGPHRHLPQQTHPLGTAPWEPLSYPRRRLPPQTLALAPPLTRARATAVDLPPRRLSMQTEHRESSSVW